MELHAPIARLAEPWTEYSAQVRVVSYPLPGSDLWATMDNGIWGVTVTGYVPGVGRIVSGRSGDPSLAILAVVGGGTIAARSWWVWRAIEWSSRGLVPTAEERLQLEARVGILREAVRRDDEAQRLYPDRPRRPGRSEWEAELAAIMARLALVGTLELVVYVGYARRWGRDEFILAG